MYRCSCRLVDRDPVGGLTHERNGVAAAAQGAVDAVVAQIIVVEQVEAAADHMIVAVTGLHDIRAGAAKDRIGRACAEQHIADAHAGAVGAGAVGIGQQLDREGLLTFPQA